MSRKPLDPGRVRPPGRYSVQTLGRRPYTGREFWLLVNLVILCKGRADYSKAVRAFCRASGREPQVAPGAKPSLTGYTRKCDTLVRRRLWRTLTGYGKPESFGHENPVVGRWDVMPLSWGEKLVIRIAHKASADVSGRRLVQFLGRTDTRLVAEFLYRLKEDRPVYDLEKGSAGLVTEAREKILGEFISMLLAGEFKGLDDRGVVEELYSFFLGKRGP